ncbi:NAD(P)-dependent alcohol dehydrogenase [Chloroflexota bacterium]
MKAVIWTAYGPPEVLHIREVPQPVPKDNEVLVKIHAAAVTAGDCEQRSLKLPLLLGLAIRLYAGINKPSRKKILGMDLAGEIESTGPDVKQFKKGDRIFATTGITHSGAYAEYICLPEDLAEGAMAAMPDNMTFLEAAGVPIGGLEALSFLRKGNIQSGDKILINGAGGTIGTFAVQLAKHFGAEITAVDSTGKLEVLRSIGADQVIDFTKENFSESGETWDIIFDIAGRSSYSGSIRALNQNGRYLLANPGLSHIIRGPWTSMTGSKKVIAGAANYNTGDLVFLKGLIEEGKIRPVIDRVYPMEQVVEAHRYVDSGQKTGNVIITMEQ